MHASTRVRAAVDRLLDDLRGIFGSRLQSFLVYGRHARRKDASRAAEEHTPGAVDQAVRTFALVESLTAGDLSQCAALGAGWDRRGLATPLILTADEFTRSLDAFPLEYGEIIAAHEVVSGANPFEGARVNAEDVRRACEIQAKSHLLHLREGYIESGARPAAVADLIVRSAPAFRALLANVARLQGAEASGGRALASHAAVRLGLDEETVGAVVVLWTRKDLAGPEATRLFPAYLEAVERLARVIDRWT